jgi:predicted AAA+ superfamily ATPase
MKGRVHRQEIAERVLTDLRQNRCALVRGIGACGKSVLAWLLALQFTSKRRSAYMLDLAEYVEAWS